MKIRVKNIGHEVAGEWLYRIYVKRLHLFWIPQWPYVWATTPKEALEKAMFVMLEEKGKF